MRLAITGPQNTGKTTLLKDFLLAFPQYFSPKETYRNVIRDNKLKVNQEATEIGQKMIRDFLYQQIKSNKRRNVIFDRCLIDNFVYSLYQHEAGKIGKHFIDESRKLMFESFKHLDALIFVPVSISVHLKKEYLWDINKNFVDAINRLFIITILEVVKKSKIIICVVSGSRKTRIKQIKKFLKIKMKDGYKNGQLCFN